MTPSHAAAYSPPPEGQRDEKRTKDSRHGRQARSKVPNLAASMCRPLCCKAPCYFSQVQAIFPERVGPLLSGGALENVNKPEPFARTVIEALADLATVL